MGRLGQPKRKMFLEESPRASEGHEWLDRGIAFLGELVEDEERDRWETRSRAEARSARRPGLGRSAACRPRFRRATRVARKVLVTAGSFASAPLRRLGSRRRGSTLRWHAAAVERSEIVLYAVVVTLSVAVGVGVVLLLE